MADLTKVTGVANADIDKIDGVAAADISKISGVTKPSGATVATKWIVGGNTGKIFYTTTPDGSSGWEELVDIGSETFRGVAIGQDELGEKRWVMQAATNAAEINYISASADMSIAGNWTTVNFPTNYIGVYGGPGIAWGDDVWISTGKRVHDGDSYRTIMRSTDGAITWTSIDHASTIDDNSNCVGYKGSDQTWIMGQQSHIWRSTDNGASWSDVSTLEGTVDIQGVCYDGTSKWVAGLSLSNVYYSTNDWDSNTEGTISLMGGQYGCVYMKGSVNKYIMVSSAGKINYSSDGATWTEAASYDDTEILYAIATDHTTVIAVGSSGMLQISSDGDSWTKVSVDEGGSPSTRGLMCIACDVIGSGMR